MGILDNLRGKGGKTDKLATDIGIGFNKATSTKLPDTAEIEAKKLLEGKEIALRIKKLLDGEKNEENLQKLRELRQKLEKLFSKGTKVIKSKIKKMVGGTEVEEEIEFDLEKELEGTKQFYMDTDLPKLAEALPSEIKLSLEQASRFEKAVELMGFDRMMVIPANTEDEVVSIAEQTHKPLAGLPTDKDYNTDGYWKSDRVSPHFPAEVQNLNRPSKKAYIMLYSSREEVSHETLNKTPDEMREYLRTLRVEHQIPELNGLTLPEYMLTQRKMTKEINKHPDTNNYCWLLDSEVNDDGSPFVLFAIWTQGSQRISVVARHSGSHHSIYGFRFSAIFEIEL